MSTATRQIVCATDFSQNARHAADVATAMALRLRATLVLVHVADQAHACKEGTKDFRAMMRDAKALLHKEARRVRRDHVAVEAVLLHGRWAEQAVGEFLAKNPPMLVIVSSVSKTAFDRWTLGSVSEHIAQHSPVPTLVVRAPERLLAWPTQERSLKVLVAVDFTVSSDAALAWVGELKKIGPCAVTVAHISWPPDEQRWLSAGSGVSLTANSADARRRLTRDLRRKAAHFVDGTFDVHVERNGVRPDAALVRVAMDTDVDLIVMGAHQRNGLKRMTGGSISRGVLRHAPMSVACVPVSGPLAHGVGHDPRISRLLVATDLSPAGDQAVPWAYAAVSAGAVVKLVHVTAPWELPSPLVPRYDPKLSTRRTHQRLREEARAKLSALVPTAALAAGIQTEVEVLDDRDPARGIGIAARRFGADAICLAAHARPAVADALFGSVVRDVVRQNPQPVLLVRSEQP
jgi:nucleotide-binding universal stress UspA family protein